MGELEDGRTITETAFTSEADANKMTRERPYNLVSYTIHGGEKGKDNKENHLIIRMLVDDTKQGYDRIKDVHFSGRVSRDGNSFVVERIAVKKDFRQYTLPWPEIKPFILPMKDGKIDMDKANELLGTNQELRTALEAAIKFKAVKEKENGVEPKEKIEVKLEKTPLQVQEVASLDFYVGYNGPQLPSQPGKIGIGPRT